MVVWFLYATAGRGIIAGDSQSYHGTVGKVDGTLNQAFTESPAAYNYSSVPVLYGTSHDFACRSGIFVNQHNETSVFEITRTSGVEIAAL